MNGDLRIIRIPARKTWTRHRPRPSTDWRTPTRQEARVLLALRAFGSATVRRIARGLGITHLSVRTLLARLEAKQFAFVAGHLAPYLRSPAVWMAV